MTRPRLGRIAADAVLVSVIVGLIAIGAFASLRPLIRTAYCDGAFPVWMLEAQGYTGGGCAEVLPSSEAPPSADWREYCAGLCNPADYPANDDYRFGP